MSFLPNFIRHILLREFHVRQELIRFMSRPVTLRNLVKVRIGHQPPFRSVPHGWAAAFLLTLDFRKDHSAVLAGIRELLNPRSAALGARSRKRPRARQPTISPGTRILAGTVFEP